MSATTIRLGPGLGLSRSRSRSRCFVRVRLTSTGFGGVLRDDAGGCLDSSCLRGFPFLLLVDPRVAELRNSRASRSCSSLVICEAEGGPGRGGVGGV